MKDRIYTDSRLEDLPAIASEILEEFKDERIFAFYGDLGAGKTTLIKLMCQALGVTRDVTSPSFAIINEYNSPEAGLIYHFDFYRLKKLEEALDIGYEEYVFSDNYCFMEWADKIEELLPSSYVYIYILKGHDEKARTISASLMTR